MKKTLTTTNSTEDSTLTPAHNACLQCGFCCKQAPCGFAAQRMQQESLQWQPAKGCPYLVPRTGPVTGQYNCLLYLRADPELREKMTASLGIGAGCSSPLFNDTREAIKRQLFGGSRHTVSPTRVSPADAATRAANAAQYRAAADTLADAIALLPVSCDESLKTSLRVALTTLYSLT